MALVLALRLWLAQITRFVPQSWNVVVGVL